jgi:hypothetical protein
MLTQKNRASSSIRIKLQYNLLAFCSTSKISRFAWGDHSSAAQTGCGKESTSSLIAVHTSS